MGKIIGISGGVAAGKSTVARLLGERGAAVVDADAIGHEVLKRPEIRERVVAQWGKDVLNEAGEVDRQKLGAVVFSSEEERTRLESIVHPAILDRIRSRIAAESAAREALVLDAALLNESGLVDLCDGVVFVEADRSTRAARAASRGWSAAECARREEHQMSVEAKRARADWIVDNSGSEADLRDQLDSLWRNITENERS